MVTFHLQGEEGEGKKIAVPEMVAGRQVFFRLAPEISHNNVAAFRPFPAEDGYSYGIVLQMNDVGRQRLASVTNANKGALLLARLNGRPLDVLKIDQGINDGFIVIWQGVTAQEIAMADSMMPRIGESLKEWKQKKKDK